MYLHVFAAFFKSFFSYLEFHFYPDSTDLYILLYFKCLVWAKRHFSSTLFCGEAGQLQVPQCPPHCDVTRRGGACISFVPIFYLAVYLFIYLFYFPSLSEAEAARALRSPA